MSEDRMENSESRLKDLMQQIEHIYLESKEASTTQKYKNYQKITLLVEEAKKLIGSLQKEISGMHQPPEPEDEGDRRAYLKKMNRIAGLLGAPNLNLGELSSIVAEFKKTNSLLPQNATIHDNVENEVVYENEEIEVFE